MSGLLGIGSGVLKVLAMDGVMRLPMKVSTATSNFMIGVTAAASAGIYLGRGDVDARLAAPVALGVLTGALMGSRILVRLRNRQVRLIFVPIMVVVACRCWRAAWACTWPSWDDRAPATTPPEHLAASRPTSCGSSVSRVLLIGVVDQRGPDPGRLRGLAVRGLGRVAAGSRAAAATRPTSGPSPRVCATSARRPSPSWGCWRSSSRR